MSNIFAPFGFAQAYRLGSAPNYQLSPRTILSTNTTAIYFGDPVCMATDTSGIGTGYIKVMPVPPTLTMTSLSWATGIMTITFSSTTAPAVGSFLKFPTLSTATTLSGTVQGPILTASATMATFAFPVTQSTDTGSVLLFQPVSGIFAGVEYYSTALKRTVWTNYWPGTTDPATNGTARVIDDPQMVFVVQGNGSVTQAMIGQNATFAYGSTGITLPAGQATVGTGNTTTGKSTACLDIAGSTVVPGYGSYLPFRIVNTINAPPGGPGTDTTSAYGWVYATFNQQDYRAGTAGI